MRKAILIILLTIAPNLFSQNSENQEVRIVNHKVMMGETVRMISKQYLVPPSEIYKLNKEAVDGIKPGMVLQIPVAVKDEPVKQQKEQESVAQVVENKSEPKKSTLLEATMDVEKAMMEVEAGSDAPKDASGVLSHRVKSGETLSGLAEQYHVSVKSIKGLNPKVAQRGLRTGETIKIPSDAAYVPSNETAGVPKPEVAVVSASEQTNQAIATETPSAQPGETISHKVQSGETLYSLARQYNVTVDAIKRQNPSIAKKGLQTGQVLKITAQ